MAPTMMRTTALNGAGEDGRRPKIAVVTDEAIEALIERMAPREIRSNPRNARIGGFAQMQAAFGVFGFLVVCRKMPPPRQAYLVRTRLNCTVPPTPRSRYPICLDS